MKLQMAKNSLFAILLRSPWWISIALCIALGAAGAIELVAVLGHADSLEAALRRAEWARAADRWTMIAATDFLARSFTWKLPGAATARGLGLAAVQGLPPLKGWLARRMMFGSR